MPGGTAPQKNNTLTLTVLVSLTSLTLNDIEQLCELNIIDFELPLVNVFEFEIHMEFTDAFCALDRNTHTH